jgi:hypothetical protein
VSNKKAAEAAFLWKDVRLFFLGIILFGCRLNFVGNEGDAAAL